MAVNNNEYTFNPRGIAVNNPMDSTDLYPGNLANGKRLYPSNDGNMSTTNAMFPQLSHNPLGFDDLQTLGAKYHFDIAQVTAVFKRDLFPFQWIADLNAKKPVAGDTHIEAEDHDQDMMFHDSMLDILRLVSQGDGNRNPLDWTNASNLGGQLLWRKLTTAAHADVIRLIAAGRENGVDKTTAAATIVNKDASSGPAYDAQLFKAEGDGTDVITGMSCEGHMLLPLAWSLALSGEQSMAACGKDAQRYIAKMAALLEGNHYKKVGYGNHTVTTLGTVDPEVIAGQRIYGYIHERNNYPVSTVHAMFDDIAMKVNGAEYQAHEVAVRIYGFFWTADYKEFVLLLDFNYANLEDIVLSGTAANNVVLLEEYKSKSTNFSGGFTRLNRHSLLGMHTSVPDPVAQGSDGDSLGNYSGFHYDVEAKQNFCQIIQSKEVQISGTYLAASGQMKLNHPQKLREQMMMDFKQQRNNLALFGKGASKKIDSATGKMTLTSAGFFCYQQNPIRYVRPTLNVSAAQNRFEALEEFVDTFARSAFAFQPNQQGSGVKTVLVSKWMLRHLDRLIKYGQQESPNLRGTNTANQGVINGNQLDLSLQYNSIKTPYGILEFKHEPSLDYMTEFRLPGFIASANVNPKHVMLAVDKSKISTVSLRPPMLKGNIQSNRADYTAEHMICEETLEVLDKKSHLIGLVNII